VGTRLISRLLERGLRVRALARDPGALGIRPWAGQVEIMRGNVLEASTLPDALEGVGTAYYLVHNMSGGRGYREMESGGARNFAEAARQAGAEHIIYLGGLGEGSGHRHMYSRHLAGDMLRSSGVPVTEFRASVIIGSGSTSLEIIRALASWMPLVPAPRQTNLPGQPIATPDLLEYLLAALESRAGAGEILEIGGPDAMRYPEMLLECARQLGLRRGRLPLPFFSPQLSARTVDWLTPVPFNIALPLVEELVAPSLVTDEAAHRVFPSVLPMTYVEAVRQALGRDEMPAGSPWMDSLITRRPLNRPHVRTRGEGLLIDYRAMPLAGAPGSLRAFAWTSLNGTPPQGWTIRAGQDGGWVRLEAQGRLPGRLYVEIEQKENILRRGVLFEPKGLTGNLVGWGIVLAT